MKVLLIRPQAPNALSFTKILDNEPLELEYLHTALAAAGIEDTIYDGLIERQTVEETLRREAPDVVAVTGYITQEKWMIGYCRRAKAANPAMVTVIGGVHAQRNFERFYDPAVDFICRSESCDAFVELVTFLECNMLHSGFGENEIPTIAHIESDETDNNVFSNSLTRINGLCFKTQKGVWTANPLVPVDIQTLPIPDRSFFYKNKSSYRYLDLTCVATMKTAFSCPYSCNFCYCTLLAGGRYSARSLDLVIAELKNIDAVNIQIVDDDFLVDRNRLTEFIRLVKENDIHKTYICYARADFVADNADLVQALADIGFKYFLVGLEAVTEEGLKGYNKQTGMDANRRCVEVIRATSAAHCIGLMIAPIDATLRYFNDLYRWVRTNRLEYVTVSIFTPIPGTPLFEEYKDRITSTDVEDWDFLHLVLDPVHMSRRAFYHQFRKLFLRLYRIARRTGIYDFMDLHFYKDLLQDYLRRKMKGKK